MLTKPHTLLGFDTHNIRFGSPESFIVIVVVDVMLAVVVGAVTDFTAFVIFLSLGAVSAVVGTTVSAVRWRGLVFKQRLAAIVLALMAIGGTALAVSAWRNLSPHLSIR